MKPITKPGQKQTFYVYDLEWYPENYQVRLVGLDDGDHYRDFGDSVRAFLDHVLTPRYSGAIFYAHAGGLADVQFVFEEILKNPRDLSIEACFSGSSAIIVGIEKDGCKWTFCDSYWLLRDKLSKIGRSIGMDKGGGDYVCPGYQPIRIQDWDDAEEVPRLPCGHLLGKCIFYAPYGILRDYNALDCRILHRAIASLENELLELGGELKMTIAGSAMRLFRGAYLKETIPVIRAVNLLARESYIASRVEPIRMRLQGPAHMFDFNSSFPYSLTKPMPGKQFARGAKWIEGDDLSLVRARVHVPSMHIPPIPMKHDERVYFPTGEWEGYFTGVDLRFLLESGGSIRRVFDVRRFHPFMDLAHYVEDLYARRKKEKDPFRKLLYKYLLNSLYGKFGESPLKEQLFINKAVPKDVVSAVSVPGIPNGIFFERVANLDHEWVIISSVTTAYSRELLTKGLYQAAKGVEGAAPPESDKAAWEAYQTYLAHKETPGFDPTPAYCDTDSIPTQGWLGHSEELGELKWEESIGADEDAEFPAPKLYRFGDKVRAKGFSPREGKKKFGPEDFMMVAQGEAIGVDRMMRVKEVLNSGNYRPRSKRIDKQVKLVTRPKRVPYADGSTRPWTVKEIGERWQEPGDTHPFRKSLRRALEEA